ncbi:MAG TPA: response regulator [Blastocatellia bacterium]|nr:response regulator [Blastocatellia bacterium]
MDQKKILIVEDSPTDMRMVAAALQQTGREIITATDGDEAIAIAKKEHPGLVLLDVILPRKNGFQVCRDLKNSPETKDIPVIIITSKTQDSDRFWGMRQGAVEYLTKPYADKDLLAAVARHIS